MNNKIEFWLKKWSIFQNVKILAYWFIVLTRNFSTRFAIERNQKLIRSWNVSDVIYNNNRYLFIASYIGLNHK